MRPAGDQAVRLEGTGEEGRNVRRPALHALQEVARHREGSVPDSRGRVHHLAGAADAPAAVRTSRMTAVASFKCHCRWRDEVREPAPDTLPCLDPGCTGLMTRFTPRWAPPAGAGRTID